MLTVFGAALPRVSTGTFWALAKSLRAGSYHSSRAFRIASAACSPILR